jgi:N-acetylneuraminic acid mutarotase
VIFYTAYPWGVKIEKSTQILIILLIGLAILPATNLFPGAVADIASSWSTLTPMPTTRGEFGVAVVNGKIFAIGGINGNGLPLNVNEEYNPQTDTWTTMTPMPTPRSGFGTAVYNGKIYVIGGTVGNGFVGNNEIYDPVSNTWETKTSMPTPRADLSANIVNDKIYLLGGKKYSSAAPYFSETNISEVYDPTKDAWSTGTPLHTAVSGYSSAVVGGKIYVMGGSLKSISLGNAQASAVNQVYDVQANNWSLAANLPNIVAYGSGAATEGFMAPALIYRIGGYYGGALSGLTQAYNVANNSWRPVEIMPVPRAYFGVAVVSDILYCLGGYDGSNWLNLNEEFKPEGYGTIAPTVLITSPENKTYAKTSLDFTTNRAAEWTGYSIDNHPNITVSTETPLTNLDQGSHNITIYANDSIGNMGLSNTVYFSIDTKPPTIIIVTPHNQSYDSTDIQLTFTVNENFTSLAYSLDGQEKELIAGNVTLPALTDGSHKLVLYATDEVGNLGQKTIYFNIALFPIVLIVALIAIAVIVVAGGYLFVKRKKPSLKKEETIENKKTLIDLWVRVSRLILAKRR